MTSNRYDLEILIRTKKQGDDIPKVEKEVENLGKRLNSALDVMNKSAVAAAAAGATFKKAFDLAKEGAQIQFAEERLDRLARSIGTTADALQNDLTAATGGLVANTELVASATDIISLGLAKDEEGVVRLATVINKLGLDMQQVILTFANNSTARLDALGLSVEDVRLKAAELEAQGFKGDSFDQAVLESLEAKLALVGDTADSDVAAFVRLETQVKNLEDSFKSYLANGLLPVVETISNGYGNQVETIIQGNVEAAKSFDELVEEGRKIAEVGDMYGGLAIAVTGTEKEVIEGARSTIEAMAAQSDSFEQFSEGLDAAFGNSRMRSLFNVYLQQLGLSEQTFYEMTRSLAEAERLTAGADAVMLRYANSTGQAAENTQDLAAATAGADAVLLQNYSNLQKVEEGYQAIADAQQLAADLALVDSFKAAADPVNELLSAQQQLAESEGEWVQRYVSNAGQVAAVGEQLAADLSDDQAKAYRNILRTVDEGSAEWLDAYNRLQNDLTESQRDALVAQQADLANQPDRLVDVYTGDSAAAEEAQARITAANEAIKQSYRETAAEAILAQNGVNQATLDLLVGIGYMTQEQADARLEYANTTTAIEDLTASSDFNRLTVEEQTAALNALIEGTAQTAEQAINLAEQQTAVNDALNAMPKAVVSTVTVRGLEDSAGRVGELLRQLDALDGRNVSANVTVNTSTAQDLGNGGGKEAPKKAAGGSVFAGGLFQAGEGNLPELLRQKDGRLFIIPGDDGQVFSNQQSRGMLGGQTINDNRQTIINANTKEAAALALASAQVSKRTRFNRSMGV